MHDKILVTMKNAVYQITITFYAMYNNIIIIIIIDWPGFPLLQK